MIHYFALSLNFNLVYRLYEYKYLSILNCLSPDLGCFNAWQKKHSFIIYIYIYISFRNLCNWMDFKSSESFFTHFGWKTDRIVYIKYLYSSIFPPPYEKIWHYAIETSDITRETNILGNYYEIKDVHLWSKLQ